MLRKKSKHSKTIKKKTSIGNGTFTKFSKNKGSKLYRKKYRGQGK